jgi:hypothetical protein
LAPKGIAKQISMKIKTFLWQGGKANHKNFHLVSWNQITNSKKQGGLGIREPEFMNLAMGAKTLWRLVTGERAWWKYALWRKYFTGTRIRCLDNPSKTKLGSPIFKLLLAARPIINEKLNWIPGNGWQIRPWGDKIMESDHLEQLDLHLPLRDWLANQGLTTLSDLSSWSIDGSWAGWINIPLPPYLSPLFSLISSLQGCAPHHQRLKDLCGWGNVI